MSNKKGLLALSPLMVFILLYVVLSVVAGDFYKVPITVIFMIASIYAVVITGHFPLQKRVDIFSRGASSSNLLLMLWIYVLAGAFAASAKQMGSIDSTVNLALNVLPSSLLLPGLFLAACFISVSIGTSVGTVVALVPIAVGIAQQTDVSTALITAIIVGGAYFGDNLSFISDTTVVATHPACAADNLRAIISADTGIGSSAGEVRFALKREKLFLFDKETEERVPFRAR